MPSESEILVSEQNLKKYDSFIKEYVGNKLTTKQGVIDSTHKLSADLVDDDNTTNKFVTATDKSVWDAKSVVSVSATGTATSEVEYITINGVEKKIKSGSNITIDSTLSGTSENPVQNKVITGALDGKQKTLIPGNNITIASDGTISATGTLSPYSTGEGLVETSGTVSAIREEYTIEDYTHNSSSTPAIDSSKNQTQVKEYSVNNSSSAVFEWEGFIGYTPNDASVFYNTKDVWYTQLKFYDAQKTHSLMSIQLLNWQGNHNIKLMGDAFGDTHVYTFYYSSNSVNISEYNLRKYNGAFIKCSYNKVTGAVSLLMRKDNDPTKNWTYIYKDLNLSSQYSFLGNNNAIVSMAYDLSKNLATLTSERKVTNQIVKFYNEDFIIDKETDLDSTNLIDNKTISEELISFNSGKISVPDLTDTTVNIGEVYNNDSSLKIAEVDCDVFNILPRNEELFEYEGFFGFDNTNVSNDIFTTTDEWLMQCSVKVGNNYNPLLSLQLLNWVNSAHTSGGHIIKIKGAGFDNPSWTFYSYPYSSTVTPGSFEDNFRTYKGVWLKLRINQKTGAVSVYVRENNNPNNNWIIPTDNFNNKPCTLGLTDYTVRRLIYMYKNLHDYTVSRGYANQSISYYCDSTLSSSSTAPVQNKVITSALAAKQDKLTQSTDLTPTTQTLTLSANTRYALGTLSALDITFPASGNAGDEIIIEFISGSTATTLTRDTTNAIYNFTSVNADKFVELNAQFKVSVNKWVVYSAETDYVEDSSSDSVEK